MFFLFALIFSLVACRRPVPRFNNPNAAGNKSFPVSSTGTKSQDSLPDLPVGENNTEEMFSSFLIKTLDEAGIPKSLAERIGSGAAESPGFILDLLACLEGDPYLYRLVDKGHSLPEGYVPEDLVELGSSGVSYTVSRKGLMLRRAAAEALEEMSAAARADGITLQVSSAYRSYTYQVEVYNRIVNEMGQESADRESARPGYSQHQAGLAVDFGSIDNSFAQTAAGHWIMANAGRYGWSLSFPEGLEELTGYRWESWHYRYVGRELASFIETWFDDIQQYALQFIHVWEKNSKN
ncbi:MAG: M15 family metallopeptidase [Treponema sp.]|nr:M15 family metallopeptidase [Treponema sp.]